MKELKVITVDNLHNTIRDFVVESQTIVSDYEDMKQLILTMIKAGYMFNMDRDRLRDAMEDITFMLCPNDDVNKDRVERGLEYEDSSEDEYDLGLDNDNDNDNDIEEIE